MPNTKHRVIFDTNIWVSFLLTKDFSKIDQLFKNNKLTLLFSQELLDEFLEVAQSGYFGDTMPPVSVIPCHFQRAFQR